MVLSEVQCGMAIDESYVCEGCDYSVNYGGGWGCFYCSDGRPRRPCKAGAGCTVRKGKPEPKVKRSALAHSWDTEKAKELCRQGKELLTNNLCQSAE